MFCNKCGAKIPDGSIFCSSCGHNFAKDSARQQLNQPIPPNQPVAPPYTPPPVYGAAPAGVPLPKQKHTGLIVLVSILSVVAAAAIVFLCLKLFAPPKAEPDNFGDVYGSLMQSSLAGVQSQTPATTPVPAATPEQTPMPADATIDLPYDFTQLDYPMAAFSLMQFSGKADFEAALWSTSWIYQLSETNPGATMFNGGYVDVGVDAASTSKHAYTFNNDYSAKLYDINSADNSILSETTENYWTQEIGGVFCALADLGNQTVYDGAGYDAVALMFINSDGNLVESLALYDAHTEKIFFISNYNILSPTNLSPAATAPPVSSNSHTPMEWEYDEEFEEMLMGVMWHYVGTENLPKAFEIPEYSDITTNVTNLIFNTDYTLDAVLADSTTDTINYGIGYFHVYIVLPGEYEYDGVIYEANHHYYIDSEGYLIESVRFYDFDLDEYFLVSNVNVYEPISP